MSDSELKVAHRDLEHSVSLLALDDGMVQLSLKGFRAQLAHDTADAMKMLAKLVALAVDKRRRQGALKDYKALDDD